MSDDQLKDRMSANRLAAVNEETARLNAGAVVERMKLMQEKLDEFKAELDQVKAQLAQMRGQMALQQTLATQIAAHGHGATA